MPSVIDNFCGPYRFLSNSYIRRFRYDDGLIYETAEHAYQATKARNPGDADAIRTAPTPGLAMHKGRRVSVIDDWDDKKIDVMRTVIRAKFLHPTMRRMLLDTGNAVLVDGNSRGDGFWGQCPVGYGENHLGRLLMELRAELAAE